MNFAPYIGSLTLLACAAGLVGVSNLSMDPDGPLFEQGRRVELLLQAVALGVSFVAGCQL